MVWCCTLYRTLRHFNTSSDEYSVLFVSSCTAGLKLVAESFQFLEPLPQSHCHVCNNRVDSVINHTVDCYQQRAGGFEELKFQHDDEVLLQKSVDGYCNNRDVSKAVSDANDDGDRDALQLRVGCCEWSTAPILKPTFLYLDDNHTSVVGMRGIIARRGIEFCCISADKMDVFLSTLQQAGVMSFCLQTMTTHMPLSGEQPQPRYIINSLFVYPAQSNFSGHRYPLEWVDMVCSRSERVSETHPHCECRTHPQWYVLLDAAALLTTSTLDLSRHKPDFVVLSFYKMFGFPTGLGT